MTRTPALPTADLDDVVARVGADWEGLRRAKLFITGGTGFVGGWLLASFLRANRELGLDATVTVLTRDPAAFTRRNRLVEAGAVALVAGDVRTFECPPTGYTHVIHAAGDANADGPEMLDTATAGTRRALAFADAAGAGSFLHVSSGAVYGDQPVDIEAMDEDHAGAAEMERPGNAYREAKRAAETACSQHAALNDSPRLTIARLFAFVGPGLPLRSRYAIGNFIADALSGGPIVVAGDGSPVRTYLYASDLAIWLWAILARGRHGRAYNVGAPDAHALRAVADVVAAQFTPPIAVEVRGAAGAGLSGNRYVPNVLRARRELGVSPTVGLADGIRRTIAWRFEGGLAGMGTGVRA